MTYEQYLEAKKSGVALRRLPDFFDDIIDDAYYTPAAIAELTELSKETVYKWFRSKQLPSASLTSRYVIQGLELKRFLFTMIWPKMSQRIA